MRPGGSCRGTSRRRCAATTKREPRCAATGSISGKHSGGPASPTANIRAIMSEIALPTRVPVGYSLGSLATGAFGTVPGLLLLPYLTDDLGVASALAGVLVLLPKAWDVVFNPIVGRISDRAGTRRPYLLGGGLALAVLFAAMFAGPFRSGAPA